jgi:hypothetical protein
MKLVRYVKLYKLITTETKPAKKQNRLSIVQIITTSRKILFPPLTLYFYLPLFKSVTKKLFLVEKMLDGHLSPCPPPPN